MKLGWENVHHKMKPDIDLLPLPILTESKNIQIIM